MILNLRKLALTQKDDSDNSGNDTSVILSNINEGIDGAAIFGITNEHSDIQIEGGHSYIDRANPSLDIRVLKPTGDAYTGKTNIDQLKEWADELTDLYISGVTLDGFVFWGDAQGETGTVKISVNEQLTDNDIFAFRVASETTPYFNESTGLHQSGFFAGNNGLGAYAWGDANGDDIADGWLNSGFTSLSFTGGQQSLTADTVPSSFTRDIYLPLEGENLTFSVTLDEDAATYASQDIGILFLDSSGSIISQSNTPISGDGRKNTSVVEIPSNAFIIRVRYRASADTGTVTTLLSDPALRIDGKTTYTKL